MRYAICLFALLGCVRAHAAFDSFCLNSLVTMGLDSALAYSYGAFPLPAPFPARVVTSHPPGTSPYLLANSFSLTFRPGITLETFLREFPPDPGSLRRGGIGVAARYEGVSVTLYANDRG